MAKRTTTWNKVEEEEKNLAMAIVERACIDYIRALQGKGFSSENAPNKSKETIKEVEKFFHSKWYALLCDTDPEYLIRMCKDKAKYEQEKSRRRFEKRQAKLSKPKD